MGPLSAAKLLIPKGSLPAGVVKGLLMTGAGAAGSFTPAILAGSRAGTLGGGRILAGAVEGAEMWAGGARLGGVTVKAGNPGPDLGSKSSDSELSEVLSQARGSKSSSLRSHLSYMLSHQQSQ